MAALGLLCASGERQPYEFCVKVGIAATARGNLIVGAQTFAGSPYDGHTLAEQIEQAMILMRAIVRLGQKALFVLWIRVGMLGQPLGKGGAWPQLARRAGSNGIFQGWLLVLSILRTTFN